MRLVSSVLSLLFAAASTMPAHSQAIADRSQHPPVASCPGNFTARRQAGPEVRWTVAREDQYRPDAKPSGHAGVHVGLASHDRVRQIEVAVQFLPSGARLTPIGAKKPRGEAKQVEQSKTFELSSSEATRTVEGDLLLGPVFKITHVRLISVQFANGTTWHGTWNSCAIEPSLYMPVDAK